MDRVLFISELYYPEETSTGYFVTGIAEGLAAEMGGRSRIKVLCAQPTYSQRGILGPRHEIRNSVEINRVNPPAGNKNRLVGRLWNAISLSFKLSLLMIREIEKGDLVIVVTNPPSMPVVAALITRIRKAFPVLLVQDIYPDVLVPVGFMKPSNFAYRMIDMVQKWMIRKMLHTVVLGRDMKSRICRKVDLDDTAISIIPNWGEPELINPERHAQNNVRTGLGMQDKFIVQFSGNLGRTHGLEDFLSLARMFKDDPRIHFFVFGWGAGRDWLIQTIKEDNLLNITVRPPCKKEELGEYLTACDLFFLPFKNGMEGISVPSRLYNVMAAGNPILAVCSEESELAMVVREEQMGFVVQPGDILRMQEIIHKVLNEPDELSGMRKRAREALERNYTREIVVRSYVELLNRLETQTASIINE